MENKVQETLQYKTEVERITKQQMEKDSYKKTTPKNKEKEKQQNRQGIEDNTDEKKEKGKRSRRLTKHSQKRRGE